MCIFFLSLIWTSFIYCPWHIQPLLTSLPASCNAACQGTKMMCTLLVRIVEHDHQQLIFLLKMGVYICIYIHLNTYIIYIMVSAGYSKNISDHCNFIAIHLENQVSGRVCLIEDLSKVDLKWEMASGCSNFRKVVRFDDPPQEKWLKPPVWKHQFDWQKWSAELRKSNLGTLSWVANEFNLCQIHMERIVVDDHYVLHHPNFSFFPT